MPKEPNPVADRRFRLSNLELLLLTAIVIGLAFMVRVVVAPGTATDPGLSAAVSELEHKVAEISERLNLAGGAASGAPAGMSRAREITEPYEELTERLDRLERKVEKLEGRSAEEGGKAANESVATIQNSPRKIAIPEQPRSD